MTLSVRQFRYSSDNLAYIIHGEKQAMAIDGGATEEILSYLSSRTLDLIRITNTHEHPDHTSGNSVLIKATGAPVLRPMDAAAKRSITVDNKPVRIYHTPGHTADSITFHVQDQLITGDTLFNGTVGNCFSGDLKAFYGAVRRLMELPENTVVYAGHDYVEYAMSFARILEPDNPHIDRFLKRHDPAHVYSTLAEEKRVNPYVRYNDPDMVRILENRGLPISTEYERWNSIMSLG